MKFIQKIIKTYINPALLQYTRKFSNEEIKLWQKEDTKNWRKSPKF